jgi:hypothetical protein
MAIFADAPNPGHRPRAGLSAQGKDYCYPLRSKVPSKREGLAYRREEQSAQIRKLRGNPRCPRTTPFTTGRCSRPQHSRRSRHTGECETDGAARLPLQRAVHCSRVVDEVAARPWVAHEELDRKHIRLQAITRRTGGNDVARHVCPALGQWVHVIQRRVLIVQRRGAVHASTATVAERGQLDLALLL